MSDRTALLINCSVKEARTIREQARLQDRTVSGYILHIVMKTIEFENTLLKRFPVLPGVIHSLSRRTLRPRTTILLRCSLQQAKQIRTAAKRSEMTISGFVLQSLRRSWKVTRSIPMS